MIDCAYEIKQSVTMRQVCEMYGIDIDRKGFVRCPFHAGDNSPSMKIYPGNRGYHCFACQRSGDSIQFVMDFFDLSFVDALAKLNSDFSIGFDFDGKSDKNSQKEAARKLALIKRNKIARETQYKRLVCDYNTLLDKFADYDGKLRECALKSEIDDIDDDQAKALREFEQTKHDFGLSEMRLIEFENGNR